MASPSTVVSAQPTNQAGDANKMNVQVKSILGNNFELNVCRNVSNKSLRELIANKCNVDPLHIQLTANGHNIEDEQDRGMVAVRSGYAIHVVPKVKTGIDTASSVISNSSFNQMQPKDMLSLLNSIKDNEAAQTTKITVVVAGNDGKSMQAQLDLSDMSQLLEAASQLENNNSSDGNGDTSDIDNAKQTTSHDTVSGSRTNDNVSKIRANSKRKIVVDSREKSSVAHTGDDGSQEKKDPDSTENNASPLPHKLLQKLFASKKRRSSTDLNTSNSSTGSSNCTDNHGMLDVASSSMDLNQRRQRMEIEFREKAKEVYQRKMENIRISRKLETYKQKRDAKKARRKRRLRQRESATASSSANSPTANSSNPKQTFRTHTNNSAQTTTNSQKKPSQKSQPPTGFAGFKSGFLC